MLLQLQYFAHFSLLLLLTELCHYSFGSTYLYSNNIRCLKTPAGSDLISEDCQSSGTFPFPYGNELGELWTYHFYRRGCFKFHHGGCIPSSPNWFYSKKSCQDICNAYINQDNSDLSNNPNPETSSDLGTNSNNGTNSDNGTNSNNETNSSNGTNSNDDLGMNVTVSASMWYNDANITNMTSSDKSPTNNETNNRDLNVSKEKDPCHALPAFGSCPNYQKYDMVLQKWLTYPEEIRSTFRHGSCFEYIYSSGNCGDNENSFESMDQCKHSCSGTYHPCEQMPFRGTLCDDRDGFDSVSVRFSYNGGICLPFQFNGCEGNENNFLSRRDCEEMCANSEDTWPRSAPQNPSWHLPYIMIENDKDGKWKLGSDFAESSTLMPVGPEARNGTQSS